MLSLRHIALCHVFCQGEGKSRASPTERATSAMPTVSSDFKTITLQ